MSVCDEDIFQNTSKDCSGSFRQRLSGSSRSSSKGQHNGSGWSIGGVFSAVLGTVGLSRRGTKDVEDSLVRGQSTSHIRRNNYLQSSISLGGGPEFEDSSRNFVNPNGDSAVLGQMAIDNGDGMDVNSNTSTTKKPLLGGSPHLASSCSEISTAADDKNSLAQGTNVSPDEEDEVPARVSAGSTGSAKFDDCEDGDTPQRRDSAESNWSGKMQTPRGEDHGDINNFPTDTSESGTNNANAALAQGSTNKAPLTLQPLNSEAVGLFSQPPTPYAALGPITTPKLANASTNDNPYASPVRTNGGDNMVLSNGNRFGQSPNTPNTPSTNLTSETPASATFNGGASGTGGYGLAHNDTILQKSKMGSSNCTTSTMSKIAPNGNNRINQSGNFSKTSLMSASSSSCLGDASKSQMCRWNFETSLDLFQQICSGIEFLHANNLAHGHLSSHNILITAEWQRGGAAKMSSSSSSNKHNNNNYPTPKMRVVVSDYGFHSCKKYLALKRTYDFRSAWSSPEILARKRHNRFESPMDLYSLGLILWEMNHSPHTEPFAGLDMPAIVEKVVVQDCRPSLHSTVPGPHVPPLNHNVSANNNTSTVALTNSDPSFINNNTSDLNHVRNPRLQALESCILPTWQRRPEERPTITEFVQSVKAVDVNLPGC